MKFEILLQALFQVFPWLGSFCIILILFLFHSSSTSFYFLVWLLGCWGKVASLIYIWVLSCSFWNLLQLLFLEMWTYYFLLSWFVIFHGIDIWYLLVFFYSLFLYWVWALLHCEVLVSSIDFDGLCPDLVDFWKYLLDIGDNGGAFPAHFSCVLGDSCCWEGRNLHCHYWRRTYCKLQRWSGWVWSYSNGIWWKDRPYQVSTIQFCIC